MKKDKHRAEIKRIIEEENRARRDRLDALSAAKQVLVFSIPEKSEL